MLDFWLEVSTHPDGPATGHLDQGFSMVFLVSGANAELVPKFHVALHASHVALSKFCPEVEFHQMPPFQD
jgi:hypothetical protein